METNNKDTIKKIILIIIIIISIVAIIKIQRDNISIEDTEESNIQEVSTQSDIELNNAVDKNTTKELSNSIDTIKVEDTTDADLKIIDDELNNL
jgi:hypothetical protein